MYLQFRRFFSELHPAVKGGVDPAIARIVRGLMPRGRPVDEELVMCDEGLPEVELGERYAALYSTRDRLVEELFFRRGVLRWEGERVVVTNRQLVMLGVHRPARAVVHQVRPLGL